MPKEKPVEIEAAGRLVAITNPSKVWFPEAGYTKLDVARYYVAVADGALRGVRDRPMQMERYVDGAGAPPFYQKRAPPNAPEWIETVRLRFPSQRTADEIVVRDLAQLLWIVNLACLSLHPHPVRADDLDHPDELRIDLDPIPGVPWEQVRDVALCSREVLEDVGLVAWPKTSGSRGMHLLVRIERRWPYADVRRAALAVAREVERRMPGRATSKWWKEERQGVFLDYNQNAKDRTVASAYSVRAKPDARVSTPLDWDEVPACDPAAFTIRTVPERFADAGDPHQGIDDAAGDLTRLLELAAAFEAEQGEAPWPPHYAKAEGEPPRVAPSRARKPKTPKAPKTSKETADATPADGASEDVANADVGSPGGGDAAPKKKRSPTGRRKSTKPLVVVAESEDEAAALAGLDRWKARHPAVAAKLAPEHVLVDKMRGQYKTWTRVRVNLEAVPEGERPPQETPDPDDAPKAPWEQ